MVAQSAKFKTAITDSKKLKAKPTDDELLEVSHRVCSLHVATEFTSGACYCRHCKLVLTIGPTPFIALWLLQARNPRDHVRERYQARRL